MYKRNKKVVSGGAGAVNPIRCDPSTVCTHRLQANAPRGGVSLTLFATLAAREGYKGDKTR
jgi:hypothetical protein